VTPVLVRVAARGGGMGCLWLALLVMRQCSEPHAV
jgi:hypothetical protein